MKRVFAAWIWSLAAVARSFRTVIVLAALIALWCFAAYKWLELPESSGLMLLVALVWAILQLFAAGLMIGGTVSGASEAAFSESRAVPVSAIWKSGRRAIVTTLVFCVLGAAIVGVFSLIFDWTDGHALEVASFLTFHLRKPVSYELIGYIFTGIELILWAMIYGVLLSFLVSVLRNGWRGAGRETLRNLAGGTYGAAFFTSLLSLVALRGIIYKLAMWRILAPPGAADYAQMIGRVSLCLILASVTALFWSLSLARLQTLRPPATAADHAHSQKVPQGR